MIEDDLFRVRQSRALRRAKSGLAAAAVCAAAAALAGFLGAALAAALAGLVGAVLAGAALAQLQDADAAPVPQAPEAPKEEAPVESLAPLTPLLEALPDPALLVDREGFVAGSNHAARLQLRFDASGLRLSSILRNPELLDAAAAAARDTVSRTVEYETFDAVEAHIRCYVAPVAWGARTAALMVFHDQTSRIHTERARSDFLANASHELRTPIASLSLLIETVLGPARNDEQSRDRFLDMMQVQVRRMRQLIDDLLSLSRIELNEYVPPTDRADLSEVADEAMSSLKAVADARGVRLVRTDGLKRAPVVGDPFQLVQVAQNLIANAIRYAPQGSSVDIALGLADTRDAARDFASRGSVEAARLSLLTPSPSNRAYAVLQVSDTGPGIARRHLPRLGERFFRVERVELGEQSGTGLGLAIVKHIVNRHRGGFVVESEVGAGTTFSVYFEGAEAVGLEAAE